MLQHGSLLISSPQSSFNHCGFTFGRHRSALKHCLLIVKVWQAAELCLWVMDHSPESPEKRDVIAEGEISSRKQRININDEWVGYSSINCLFCNFYRYGCRWSEGAELDSKLCDLWKDQLVHCPWWKLLETWRDRIWLWEHWVATPALHCCINTDTERTYW